MPGFFGRFRRSPSNPKVAVNSRKRLFIFLSALSLCVAAAIGANYWLKQNARLWIVNGLPQGMLVVIDDTETVFISEQSYREITIPEGRHRAKLVEPNWPGRGDSNDFELRHSLIERFLPSHRPQHVLAPGRTAALAIVRERQSEPGGAVEVVARSWTVGRFYSKIRDIDLPFLDFPVRDKGDPLKGPLEKTSLSVSREPLTDFVSMKFASNQPVPGGVLDYAETQLLGTPSQTTALYQYIRLAVGLNQGDRALSFLAWQLSKRPLWHEWHRAYQAAAERIGRRDELVREYDANIEKEALARGPTYSGMLYLRGRLERDDEQLLKYMRQAVEAHPGNYYAWYAAGFTRLAQGRLTEAEEGIGNAFRLRTFHVDYRNRYLALAVALGQTANIQRMLNRHFNSSHSADLEDQQWLLAALLVGGDLKAVEPAQKRFAMLAEDSTPGDPGKLALQSRLHWLYLQAKFAEMIEQSKELGDHPLRYQALLELGRLKEIPDSAMLVKADPYEVTNHLLLSVAWRQQGQQAEADAELKRTIELLEEGAPDEQLLASFLKAPGKVTLGELKQVTIDPLRKALAVLALVQNGAPQREELLDFAGILNFSRQFPYHFVTRTVTELKVPKARG